MQKRRRMRARATLAQQRVTDDPETAASVLVHMSAGLFGRKLRGERQYVHAIYSRNKKLYRRRNGNIDARTYMYRRLNARTVVSTDRQGPLYAEPLPERRPMSEHAGRLLLSVQRRRLVLARQELYAARGRRSAQGDHRDGGDHGGDHGDDRDHDHDHDGCQRSVAGTASAARHDDRRGLGPSTRHGNDGLES